MQSLGPLVFNGSLDDDCRKRQLELQKMWRERDSTLAYKSSTESAKGKALVTVSSLKLEYERQLKAVKEMSDLKFSEE